MLCVVESQTERERERERKRMDEADEPASESVIDATWNGIASLNPDVLWQQMAGVFIQILILLHVTEDRRRGRKSTEPIFRIKKKQGHSFVVVAAALDLIILY